MNVIFAKNSKNKKAWLVSASSQCNEPLHRLNKTRSRLVSEISRYNFRYVTLRKDHASITGRESKLTCMPGSYKTVTVYIEEIKNSLPLARSVSCQTRLNSHKESFLSSLTWQFVQVPMHAIRTAQHTYCW
jgi:hypothetical protein